MRKLFVDTIGVLLATVLLAACSGDGDRSSQLPTSPGSIQVNCKSPITNEAVPLSQWRKDARQWRQMKLAQSIGNTNVTTVSVDCGDEVVFAPEPVAEPEV